MGGGVKSQPSRGMPVLVETTFWSECQCSTKLSKREIEGMTRRGITVLELLVAVSIIGLLMALLIPAVQNSREAARRTQCQSHLRQLGVAMHGFHEQHGRFPIASSGEWSFHVKILPFIDQTPLFNSIPAGSGNHVDASKTRILLFECPSDSQSGVPHGRDESYPTSYAVNYGSGVQRFGHNGLFRTGPLGVSAAEVTDGLSNTAAIAEILIGNGESDIRRSLFSTAYPLLEASQLDQFAQFCRDTGRGRIGASLNWFRGRSWSEGPPLNTGYNHVLLPNDVSCINATNVQEGAYSAGSEHPGGVHVLFGDGHTDFVSTTVDFAVWRALGSRDGSEVIP